MEIIKPKFEQEIKAEIKGIATIENNIGLVKDYALNLKEYYKNIVFSEEEKKDAEIEKAQINKQIKQVSDFRKAIMQKYNEPIKQFETTAKETEKILKETYEFINEQVKVFDQAELEDIRNKMETYFNEYAASKEIDFVTLEDMNISITKSCVTATNNLTKKVINQINEFIDSIKKDLEIIADSKYKEEVLIEYKKSLRCAAAIIMVQERHEELDKLQQQKEETPKKEQHLSAPTEEKKYSMTFTVHGTVEQLKELKKYLEKEGLLNE